MELSDAEEEILDRWLSAVETGKPGGDYSNVTILSDNPKGNPQITYGKHQTTEAGGNLKKLLRNYIGRGSALLSMRSKLILEAFIKAPQYVHAQDKDVHAVLKQVGSDPVMHDVQNEFFLEHYMKPARKWAEDNGFTLPLSMLVIYDSFIQSGGIASYIRNKFSAVPPSRGGDERRWISAYADARHRWLSGWGNGRTAKSKAIRSSRYRTRALNHEINTNNWELDGRQMVVNNIPVIAKPKGITPTRPPKTTCPTCSGSGLV